jgi:AcrR family transcriptional regulator
LTDETERRYRLSVTATPLAPLRPPVAGGSQEERILDAALVCIARWGLAKTGLDDVAREAGVSRATVYRAFPGGKDAVIEAVASAELARFFAAVDGRLAAAESLEDLLVAGMTEAGTRIATHAALRALVSFEPEVILPRLAFDRMDDVLARCTAFAAPRLARFLDEATAPRVAEWAARVVVSYSSWPSVDLDLTDEASVRRVVRQLFLPALATTGSST